MTEQKALTKFDQIKALFRSGDAVNRFMEVLGNKANAQAFISSVMIAVANNPKLQECTPASVYNCAMRAATLRLSVDPSLGHAHLVPYKGSCSFQVGYKGFEQLALRTGKYRYINLATIWEGQTVEEDQLKGIHKIHGLPTSRVPVGYLLYFELFTGYTKTYYMTVDECEDHGRRYSPSYNFDTSVWKTNPTAMHKKTVIKLGLSRWGFFDPSDKAAIDIADNEQSDTVDADWMERAAYAEEDHPKKSADVLVGELMGEPAKPAAQPVPAPVAPLAERRVAAWQSTRISAQTAAGLVSSDGTPYMALPIKDLQGRVIGLKKKIADNHLTPEQADDARMKLDAAQAIIALGID